MTRYPGLGFKHMHERIVHLDSECPEGKIIPIAKSDKVNTTDPEAIRKEEKRPFVWTPHEGGRV
jgi:hypothetical protein